MESETFHDSLKRDEHVAYLEASLMILEDASVSREQLSADPTLLLSGLSIECNGPKLDITIRCIRYWRWKSRSYYEASGLEKQAFISLLDRQDATLLKHLASAISSRSSDPTSLQDIRIVCYLMNSILLENPHMLLRLLKQMSFPPETLPFLVEFVPAAHMIIDAVPELLNLVDAKYDLYFLDLASWLALKYPSQALSKHLTAKISSIQVDKFSQSTAFIKFLTIVSRTAIAFPLEIESWREKIEQCAAHSKSLSSDIKSLIESKMASVIDKLVKNSFEETYLMYRGHCSVFF